MKKRHDITNFFSRKKIVAEVAGACLYEIYLTDSQIERMDKTGAFGASSWMKWSKSKKREDYSSLFSLSKGFPATTLYHSSSVIST